VTNYLVESYTPTTTDLDEVERRASRAAEDLSVAGHMVRYVRSIYVAEDETCFYLFDAESADTVRLASERADLHAQRIVPAVEHEPL
jgi:uncharacterized protein DUF4242